MDRHLSVKAPHATDQWIQLPQGVVNTALWVCIRTASQLLHGDPVAKCWGPQAEANPWTIEKITRARHIYEIPSPMPKASMESRRLRPTFPSAQFYQTLTTGAEDFLVSFSDLDEGAEEFKNGVAWVTFHAVASEIVKAFSAADCFVDCRDDLLEVSSPRIPRVTDAWIQSDL